MLKLKTTYKQRTFIAGLIILMLYSTAGYAQTTDKIRSDSSYRHKKVRNVFWVTPSNTDKINGLSLGLYNAPPRQKQQIINGLAIELPIIWIGPAIAYALMSIPLPVHNYLKYSDSFKIDPDNIVSRMRRNTISDTVHKEQNEFIRGIDISIGALGNLDMSGLNINILTSNYLQCNGVAISGLANWIRRLNGLNVATIGNVSHDGSGVQVGLVNSCVNCSGLQIGLLNQNGRRITPFIGYRSKKRAKVLQEKANKIMVR